MNFDPLPGEMLSGVAACVVTACWRLRRSIRLQGGPLQNIEHRHAAVFFVSPECRHTLLWRRLPRRVHGFDVLTLTEDP